MSKKYSNLADENEARRLANLQKLNSHYSHFHFIRHYALATFFYALICLPCVINENVERFADLRSSLFVDPPVKGQSEMNLTPAIPNV